MTPPKRNNSFTSLLEFFKTNSNGSIPELNDKELTPDSGLCPEVKMIKEDAYRQCINITEDHLDKFLALNQLQPIFFPAPSTYEEWIADLHPENTRSKRGDPTDKLDHRFYLPESDHRILWNSHNLVTPERHVIPQSMETPIKKTSSDDADRRLTRSPSGSITDFLVSE
eukprot:FR736584.1.p1 GENE.FR736584.1~~FR736584.1.p1  ORF type:complete len:180 (+),score=0.27 FR736584.1:35-541(+)